MTRELFTYIALTPFDLFFQKHWLAQVAGYQVSVFFQVEGHLALFKENSTSLMAKDSSSCQPFWVSLRKAGFNKIFSTVSYSVKGFKTDPWVSKDIFSGIFDLPGTQNATLLLASPSELPISTQSVFQTSCFLQCLPWISPFSQSLLVLAFPSDFAGVCPI